MMSKKVISIICVITLLAAMLGGCQSSGNGEYKIVNPNQKNKVESEEKNTLTVWCWDPAFNMNAMQKAEEVYKKEHPDFKLNIVETPSEDVQTKLETAVLSSTTENLPDIILLQDRSFQKNVITYTDGFVDLTDKGIQFDNFSAGKLGFSTVDGKNYGVPFDNGAVIACYRTDILKKAGFTVKDFENITWDEYIKKGKIVLKKTGVPMLSFVKGGTDQIVMLMQSAGGGFFDEDGKVDIKDNDVLKEVMKTYTKLIKEGLLVEVNDWDRYIASINEGKVAGVINGCWIMASVQGEEQQSGKWEITNMPRLTNVSGATNYANQGGSSWAVTTGCKNVDLAVDFLGSTFGGSVEFYDNILNSGAISCYLPAGESEMYGQKNEFFSGDEVYTKILDYAGKIPSCITGVYFNEASEALSAAISNVTEGNDLNKEILKVETRVKESMKD